jgi:hypothetical protein
VGLVHKLRETKRRTEKKGEANPLTGLMSCAQCGSRHYVSTTAVREIILDIIRKTSGFVRQHETEFAEKISEASTLLQGETFKTHKRQITVNERRIGELDKTLETL